MNCLKLCLAFAFATLYSAGQSGGDHSMSLEGAWNIKVTPEPGRNTAPFDTLHVFGFGGTTVNTASFCNFLTATPNGTRCSNGVGAWRRVGDKRFTYSFVAHLFNASGQHIGFSEVRGFFVLEGKDALKGDGEVFVYLGTDFQRPTNVIRLGAETSVGVRIIAPGP